MVFVSSPFPQKEGYIFVLVFLTERNRKPKHQKYTWNDIVYRKGKANQGCENQTGSSNDNF